MKTSKSYNGHKNYNFWNVSLWINNDEGLYRLAQECLQATTTKDLAAERMMWDLQGDETPDGVKYTKSSVRAALVGM